MSTGGFIIRDRRRKPDEPFNPFAANANQVRQKKRSERNQVNTPQGAPQSRATNQTNHDANELRKRQEELRKKMGANNPTSTPTVQKPAVKNTEATSATTGDATQQISRADRLAELRKQSQESIKKTELILEPNAQEKQPIIPSVEADLEIKKELEPKEAPVMEKPSRTPEDSGVPGTKNVFKQIVTKAPKQKDNRRRRSRHDDSAGGRQPKIKKLNRQKYNDYKYAARDILDNESVSDEHRSNLLGQIWAKGERIGVQATMEFIDEKQEQLIIDEDVAQKLRDLVKALTTRR